MIYFGGGILIGFGATILLYFNGRIAGISGILGNLVFPKRTDFPWQISFLLGLIFGGVVLFQFNWIQFPKTYDPPIWQLVLAGLLVGLGTRIGGGCTSGHGVCGIGRISKRSILATIIFIFFGAISVWIFY